MKSVLIALVLVLGCGVAVEASHVRQRVVVRQPVFRPRSNVQRVVVPDHRQNVQRVIIQDSYHGTGALLLNSGGCHSTQTLRLGNSFLLLN